MKPLQRLLLDWYAASGRQHLPWRRTRNPYRVLVSEFMLQQTQVDRVLPKYETFIDRFPDVESLARATTADVLRMWKGLGYNSRAVRLKQVAQSVVESFAGTMPHEERALRSLPGVGAYTAAAIRAFAFNLDDAAVDTNVRRVVHRLLHGLEQPAAVCSRVVDDNARALVPRGRGHDWNSAMMDLGASICTARRPKCLICPLQSVCQAAPIDAASLQVARPQSIRNAVPFKHTTRYARGRIVDRLRALPPGKRISLLDLHHELFSKLNRSRDELDDIVAALARDGLVSLQEQGVALAQ
jgi:A/G-specific adenine glycosylase